jgi:heme o synthase
VIATPNAPDGTTSVSQPLPAAGPLSEAGSRAITATPAGPALDHSGPGRARSAAAICRGLFLLTKPRIIELLLVTTLPAMLLARRGVPSAEVIAATLLGGALAAGSANTLNCYFDRDIDAIMHRTRRRPLVASGGRAVIKPPEALASGIALAAAATVLLGLLSNWLAAALADGAIVFYVFVYTLTLKRRTAANIVIGGAAGCFPVLVGWAAVTGQLSWPALELFAIIFLWTPPHFWALALKFRDDYAAAGVPMLPVVATPAAVTRKVLLYSYAMVVASLVLSSYAGWLYGCCAAGLGAWFLTEAHSLNRRIASRATAPSLRLFHVSIGYLTLLFAAIAATALLPWARW